MAVKFHPLARGAIAPDMMCWTVRAQTLHFVKLGTLQPDTPTVPVVLVTFVRLMGLWHRNQKARFVWGKSVVSPTRQRSKNIE